MATTVLQDRGKPGAGLAATAGGEGAYLQGPISVQKRVSGGVV